MRIAYLFPDTNLFIQCKPLQELDWSVWREYEEIHVLVTRPVQKEIDKHKKTGGDRLARRSRTASSLLRRIVRSKEEHEVIQKDGLTIKVMLLGQRPTPALEEQLDYSDFDDALVGTVHAFINERHLDCQSWLLTHDTGPMLTAKAVGVPVFEIPDDWLLDPEPSTEAKRISELEHRLRRLEILEPRIGLICLGENGRELDEKCVLELHVTRWLPLSEEEIARLLSRLRARFPEETNFEGVKTEEIVAASEMSWTKAEYVPADEEAIERYREEEYPDWIEQAESLLKTYQNWLNAGEGYPTCTVVARNDGSRPAEDVLVTFEAKGAFRIGRPDVVNAVKAGKQPSFTPSPKPPKGRWEVRAIGLNLHDVIGNLPDLGFLYGRMPDFPDFIAPGPLAGLGSRDREPNEFYWVKSYKKEPLRKILSLECKQWRHGKDNSESFEIAIASDVNAVVTGVLECHIQASNTTQPSLRILRLKIVAQELSVLEKATELVEEFCR